MSDDGDKAPESFYEVLGVAENADARQIKKAYRRLSADVHPEVDASPEASAKYQLLTEAYETLRDINKRAAYDGRRLREKLTGSAAPITPVTPSPPTPAPAKPPTAPAPEPVTSSPPTAPPSSGAQQPAEMDVSQAMQALGGGSSEGLGRILGEAFKMIASQGANKLLKDVVEFLEDNLTEEGMEAELEEMFLRGNVDEIRKEMNATDNLLEQLRSKCGDLEREKLKADRVVRQFKEKGMGDDLLMKAAKLEDEMKAVEKSAGLKAQIDQLQEYIRKLESRSRILNKKYAELSYFPGGTGRDWNLEEPRERVIPIYGKGEEPPASPSPPPSRARQIEIVDDLSSGEGEGAAKSITVEVASKPRQPQRGQWTGLSDKEAARQATVDLELERLKKQMGLD
ncbi:unnamed protein product [Vitrella brassicaformis CCMP3155]|uniref:J domain-containing protein n=1 Tax=Vitrella brassicaformis (strain CCMP3155) TaxID=1169540 RepID=A0A0G4EWL3_VITBC|nr:unnamed protein product [Vitrella brassicaformis CCMP3155]|eukprot:CEM03362.1 unnamed protein product [Vitrella brassicaformis CCMP3155]